ncbi:SRPBCC family protein [Cellulomonas sp. Leaf334]|uniref:SRPBCC family protein n=1 Tax=Cellulomonas sp. Leaf334 TaxID=1736339 RepID=UPI0006F82CC4|nr:SRPBCC family protein [Cellulomonas sp. Leaf334]KQR17339.1 polyketide cyclase [Cellulomonas sp. Leaf334]
MTIIDSSPLFAVSESIEVDASPAEVFATVSDLGRSGDWSPECRGGTWTGEPGAVGSVFRGENYRAEDVVGWAPLVRGTWFTEAEVVEADAPATFRWAMRTHTGATQSSVWGFVVEETVDGCRLTHDFVMREATEGIHKIVAGLDEADRERFVEEWGAKLVDDVRRTLARIKDVVEAGVVRVDVVAGAAS